MTHAIQNFLAYDNPLSLVTLSSLCVVRNIKHFINEEEISDRTFYLWKEGLSFSDATLEQLFQATINSRGKLDARWITLFLGSRRRAQQFFTSLVSPPAPAPHGITGEVYLNFDRNFLHS